MSLVKIDQTVLECFRCRHKWIPRNPRKVKTGEVDVRICPKCKSPYWDRKRE